MNSSPDNPFFLEQEVKNVPNFRKICDKYQNLMNWLMIVEDDLNSNNCDLYLYQSSIMMRTYGVQ